MMVHNARLDMLNRVGIRVVVEPTTEQITLDQAYLHLRLDAEGSPPTHPDDNWLIDNIPTAREWCEVWSGRVLAPQVMEMSLGRFPTGWSDSSWGGGCCVRGSGEFGLSSSAFYPINLTVAPVLGIEWMQYVDSDGDIIQLLPTDYILDDRVEPCLLYPAFGTSWPTAREEPNAITVRFHAGHTTPSDSPNDRPLPKRYRSAMLLVLAHLFENRENSSYQYKVEDIPLGAANLMEGRERLRLSFA